MLISLLYCSVEASSRNVVLVSAHGKDTTEKRDNENFTDSDSAHTSDSAIQRINHFPVDKYYGNQLRFSLGKDLSSAWIALFTFGTLGV